MRGAPSWSQHSSAQPRRGVGEAGLPFPLAPNLELSTPHGPAGVTLIPLGYQRGWGWLFAEPQFKGEKHLLLTFPSTFGF